jgi:competence protein ComEC
MKTRNCAWLTILLCIFCLLAGGCAAPKQPASLNSSSQTATQNLPVRPGSPAPQTYESMLKVHFIDVGQGDAILVQTPAGQTMLVDAGEADYGDRVINYLVSQGVKELDIVVGAHPHTDHIGGMAAVINYFPVKSIYMPKVSQNTETFRNLLNTIKSKGLKISTARAGVELLLNGVTCRFVAPLGDSYQDLNNYSGVIKLEYGTKSFLLTGDAETESESQMLSGGDNLSAAVLKVGHHGSDTSTGSKFLKAVSPQYAVIMVGKDNPYGHPHSRTLSRLVSGGVKVYRTDRNGTVVFTSDGQDIQISQGR